MFAWFSQRQLVDKEMAGFEALPFPDVEHQR
jgi:hypothetical protein